MADPWLMALWVALVLAGPAYSVWGDRRRVCRARRDVARGRARLADVERDIARLEAELGPERVAYTRALMAQQRRQRFRVVGGRDG